MNISNPKPVNPISGSRKDFLIGGLLLVGMVLLGYSIGGSDQPPNEIAKTRSAAIESDWKGKFPLVVEDRINAVWKAGTPTAQLVRSSDWEAVTDPVEIKKLLDSIDKLPANLSKECACAALLRNWVSIEPECAIRWCQTHSVNLLPQLIESWAVADIESVRSKLLTASDDRQVPMMAGAAIQLLADSDPPEAFKLLREVSHRLNRVGLFKPAIKKLAQIDSQQLLDTASHFDEHVRELCRTVAAAEMAKSNPGHAIQWVQGQPDGEELMVTVGRELDSAFWHDALAASQAMALGEPKFIDRWAARAPRKFLELVNGMENVSSRFEKESFSAARTIYRGGEKDAIQWLESLKSDKMKALAASAKESMNHANAYKSEMPPGKTAHEVISSKSAHANAFFRLPSSEREKLAAEIQQLPGADAINLVEKFISMETSLPFEISKDLLAAVSLDDVDKKVCRRMDSLVRDLAFDWGALAPQETAEWVTSLPLGSARDEAIEVVAKKWAVYDAEAAKQWEAANTVQRTNSK